MGGVIVGLLVGVVAMMCVRGRRREHGFQQYEDIPATRFSTIYQNIEIGKPVCLSVCL